MSLADEPRFPHLEVDVAAAAAEEVGAALFDLGASGVEVRDDTTLSLGPGNGQVRLIAGFATRATAERAAAAVAVAVEGSRPAVGETVGDEWLEKYKEHFAPFVLTETITVAPPWARNQPGEPAVPGSGCEPPAAGRHVLWMDPGRAFGTGLHASTALVAAALEAHRAELRGARVLDVGTGSGILGLVALLLGAAEAVAVDNDPTVLDVARQNAARNALTERMLVSTTPVAAVAGCFPVVVANLQAELLVELAPVLTARTASAGLLVVSGVLADRRDDVLAAYVGSFVHLETTRRGEGDDAWVAIALRRGG